MYMCMRTGCDFVGLEVDPIEKGDAGVYSLGAQVLRVALDQLGRGVGTNKETPRAKQQHSEQQGKQ